MKSSLSSAHIAFMVASPIVTGVVGYAIGSAVMHKRMSSPAARVKSFFETLTERPGLSNILVINGIGNCDQWNGNTTESKTAMVRAYVEHTWPELGTGSERSTNKINAILAETNAACSPLPVPTVPAGDAFGYTSPPQTAYIPLLDRILLGWMKELGVNCLTWRAANSSRRADIAGGVVKLAFRNAPVSIALSPDYPRHVQTYVARISDLCARTT